MSQQPIRYWTIIDDGMVPIADALKKLLRLDRDAFDYVGTPMLGPCGQLSEVIFQEFTVNGTPGHNRLDLIRDGLTAEGHGGIGDEIAERARKVVRDLREWEQRARSQMHLREFEIKRIGNVEKRRPELRDLFGCELIGEMNDAYDEAEYFEKYLRRIAIMLGPKLKPKPAESLKPPEGKLPMDPKFMIDQEARIARWKNKVLKINAHAHFDVLSELYADRGRLSSYARLLKVIKPGEALDSVQFKEVPTEIKLAVTAIRAAMKSVGCPIEIKAVKSKGYRLQGYE